MSPCSRVSWRRAEVSICWPDSSATTSSGCVSVGRRSATIRPWRSTTMRSASRNIWSMSWQASMIVVPCSLRFMISASTCADSLTPSEAVGSSRASSRGLLAHRPRHRDQLPLPAGQRPDVAGGVHQRDAQRVQDRCGGRVKAGIGHHQPPRLPAEQDVRRHVQVVAQRQVLPDHGDPALGRPSRIGRDALAREEDLAGGGHHGAGDAADQGRLARAVLARQRDELAAAHAQADIVQGAHPAVADAQPGHGQQRGSGCCRRPARAVAARAVAARAVAARAVAARAVASGPVTWAGSAPTAASLAATREPVMPSLWGLNRALGHNVHRARRADQVFSRFLYIT